MLLKGKPAYEKLKFYQDICDIRRFIHKITSQFSKTHKMEREGSWKSPGSEYRKATLGNLKKHYATLGNIW